MATFTKAKETTKKKDRFYKGYEIGWLKEIGPEHPDFNLVAEYEAKNGVIK